MKTAIEHGGIVNNDWPVKAVGPVFYDKSKWPELSYLEKHYIKMREEITKLLDEIPYVSRNDGRDLFHKWRVVELSPDTTHGKFKSLNPKYSTEPFLDKLKFTFKITNQLFKNIQDLAPTIGISILEPGGVIDDHNHNARICVMLPLTCDYPTYMIANGEKKYFEEGKLIVFNFGYPHSVYNESETSRLAVMFTFDEPTILKIYDDYGIVDPCNIIPGGTGNYCYGERISDED